MTHDSSLEAHWNSYYAEGKVPQIPSQFAVFVANEFRRPRKVVELGCGNGRDSLFFARHGWDVVGVDGSNAAIKACTRDAVGIERRPEFICSSVADDDLYQGILRDHLNADEPLLVYARFFLHAIDPPTQTKMMEGIRTLIEGRDGALAVEFRTPRDSRQTKVTADHYRRYIEPKDLVLAANDHGLSVDYFVEGFGFAKYRDDDAYVARFLLSNGTPTA